MLLDTNAYSALALGVPSVIEAVKDSSVINLPLPVIAELRYGFAKGSKPEQNEQVLQRFLAQEQVSIAIPTIRTTEYYASIQLFCTQRGRALSYNDIWIAALAREYNDTLITFDHDFEVLQEIFGDKLNLLDN